MCINLERLKILWQNIKENGNVENLSEIDTEVLFIEPILLIAGWNIFNPQEVRRANRDTKKQNLTLRYILKEI